MNPSRRSSTTSANSTSSELLDPFWPDLFSPYRQLALPSAPAVDNTTITQYHISNWTFALPCVSPLGDSEKGDIDRVTDGAVDELLGTSGYVALDGETDVNVDRQDETWGASPTLTLDPDDSVSICEVQTVQTQFGQPGDDEGRVKLNGSRKQTSPFEQSKNENKEERQYVRHRQEKKRIEKWLAGVERKEIGK